MVRKIEHAFEATPGHPLETPHPASGCEKQAVVVEGATRRKLDPVRSGVDGRDLGPGDELYRALGVKRLGAKEHAVQPGPAGEVVLGERGALVRRLVFLRHEEDLPVESLPAKAVHGLPARLPTAHHDDP